MTTEPDNKTYFLYALVKEVGESTRTNLRIVYWAEYEDYPAGFVVYGDRTPIESDEEYITYRLRCYSIAHVVQFVKTILVSPVIELHQFVGIIDNSEDAYHIDWQNTPEDKTTEILAFSFDAQESHLSDLVASSVNPIPRLNGNLDFYSPLENVLTIIENIDVV